MKKFMILASVVAIVVAALALPALAQRGGQFSNDDEPQPERFADNFLENFYAQDNDRWEDDNDRWEDNNDWWDHNDWWKDHDDRNDNDFDNRNDDDHNDNNRNNNNRNDNNNNAVPVITQEFDQEAQSGDVSQSFNVSNTGDNSNQCAGIQGVANTGNAQNQTSLIQYDSEADDFEFDEVGSTITVEPNNTYSCTTEVNQAASASG